MHSNNEYPNIYELNQNLFYCELQIAIKCVNDSEIIQKSEIQISYQV